MALQTTTEIYVSGTAIHSYVSLKLVQEIDAHHDLELVCRTDVVEKLSEELIGDSKDYLGGIITVQISAIKGFDGYKELEFKGLITRVKSTKGFDLSTGDLVTLYAKSTSILADDGSHYASFNDVDLADILDQTFQGYDKGKLETAFSPVFSDAIHYSVQHNQSAFSYASRLAAYYNEWFYYDGKKLVFGSPSTEETALTYGVDLQHFSLELSSIPNSFDYFTNDYLTDEVHQKSSTEVTTPSEGYHGFANQKSKQLFKKQTQVYHNLYSDTSLKQRLDTQIEHYTKAVAMKQVIVKGSSDNPGVNLGEIIKVKGYGNYRIIKVTHTNIEGGVYKNDFEAVDANFTTYPKMNIYLYPKSETQIATVIENADPDGLSRIRVQFPWQKSSGELTPWLRVVSPHAGSDKGFHFIPEEGEEVLVGFEGGNAERPYVMGSLYHGGHKAEAFKNPNNDIKALKTRSGHTIELNDKDGEQTIKILDKKGNTITLDSAKSSITISAPDSITLSSKEINIEASEKVKMDGTNNVEITSKEVLVNGSSKVTATSKVKAEVVASSTLVKGNIELKMESTGITDINGTTMTNVKGGLLNLNCG